MLRSDRGATAPARHREPLYRFHAKQLSTVKNNVGIVARARPEYEPDLIERMVAAVFGKKALEDPEPFGLKRIDFSKLPDQYVSDELAAPLSGDSEEVALFR
jgi:hypothetical protein